MAGPVQRIRNASTIRGASSSPWRAFDAGHCGVTGEREQSPDAPTADHRSIEWVAVERITESGAGGISLDAIASRLGMTGPALFRSVRSRNDLLTALILDACVELGDALRDSVEWTWTQTVPDRPRAYAFTLRGWALANRSRYLLFGSRVPGSAATVERLTGLNAWESDPLRAAIDRRQPVLRYPR